MANPRFHRILLKLSGDALGGNSPGNFSVPMLQQLASEIQQLQQQGIQLALVVGAGNICRGTELEQLGIGRVQADTMGMLSTVINGLMIQDVLQRHANIPCSVLSAISMTPAVCEAYSASHAIERLKQGHVVICTGGTSNPYFTTDTAASLRALELNAQVLLKATQVDGVYDKDPKQHPQAKRYQRLNYNDVIQQQLNVMDLTSICLCQQHHIPICVFNILQQGNLLRAITGDPVGTWVSDSSAKSGSRRQQNS
ncbi:MAG: UMP kinase [Myxococcota bacterium]